MTLAFMSTISLPGRRYGRKRCLLHGSQERFQDCWDPAVPPGVLRREILAGVSAKLFLKTEFGNEDVERGGPDVIRVEVFPLELLTLDVVLDQGCRLRSHLREPFLPHELLCQLNAGTVEAEIGQRLLVVEVVRRNRFRRAYDDVSQFQTAS